MLLSQLFDGLLYLAIALPIGYVLFLFAKSHVVRAVFARNVMSFFSGILGYLFLVVFVVVASMLAFNAEFFTANLANLDQLTKSYPLLLLFIVPAITMTVWAEERNQGTDELLFTLPAKDREILIGKYLAVLAVYSVALLFATGLWAVLATYADPGFRMFVSTYLGYWLAGASLLAVGMFASALTKNAAVAFVLGGVFCAVPVFLSPAALSLTSEFFQQNFGRSISPWLLEPLSAFSVGEHLHEFSLGVIRLSSVLYFESLAVLFLYLNLIVISERHWSGKKKWQMGLQYAVRSASVLTILISLYVVVTASSGRADIDLTPQKSFTLSQSTNEILDKINPQRPVTIQAFLSPNMPAEYLKTKRRLEGLLRQIDQRGGELVEVQIRETKKYQPAAKEAKSFGISPQKVAVEQDGREQIEEVFLGVVISSSYDQVVIPFFGNATPMEFEITRALKTVSNANRLTVGILETQAHVMTNPNTREFLSELRQQYNVVPVSAEQPIQRKRLLFPLEDQQILSNLSRTESETIPESLRELCQQKNAPLSGQLHLTYDSQVKTWTLKDLGQHRQYTIRPQPQTAEKETPEKPAPEQFGVYVERYDVLIAVLPSTLSPTAMPHFVRYIQDGGATLILDDPLPVNLQMHRMFTLAPSINVRPPSELRDQLGPHAENGTASSLMTALNLSWSNRHVVWDLYNPYPAFEAHWPPGMFTVVGEPKDSPNAINQEHEISKGLKRLMLFYAGSIRVRNPDLKTIKVTPLLTSSKTASGVYTWEDFAQTGQRNIAPLGRPQVRVEFFVPREMTNSLPPMDLSQLSESARARVLQGTGFRPDATQHVFAARIRSLGEGKINAVYVTDADLISNNFFQLRRAKYRNLNFDNVSFVLNAIDDLAGDDSLLELRRRKNPQPSLAKIEELKQVLAAKRRQAETTARTTQAKQADELQQLHQELLQKIKNSETQALEATFAEANMTLLAEKKRIEEETKQLKENYEAQLDDAKAEYEQEVKATENKIRIKAIVLPALPAIFLGLVFLGIRLINEQKDIPPSRRLTAPKDNSERPS